MRAGGVPPHRRQRAPSRGDLGDQAARTGRRRAGQPKRPRARVRFIILLARLFGTKAVTELVQALEGDEEDAYDAQGSPEVAAIAADEREHAEIWKRLEREASTARGRRSPATGRTRREDGRACPRPGRPRPDIRWRGPVARPDRPARGLAPDSARSGTLRAVIFGVSDGLVSNLSLVMGVAGARPPARRGSSCSPAIAGLLAGSFSMAAGEYISMQSQRELFERQIELERAELEAMPAEEQAELAAIYRSKGFTRARPPAIAAPHLPGPGDGARHARPRGAGPRPRPARVAVGRRGRLVRGVRGRRGRCRSCRTCSAAAPRRSSRASA